MEGHLDVGKVRPSRIIHRLGACVLLVTFLMLPVAATPPATPLPSMTGPAKLIYLGTYYTGAGFDYPTPSFVSENIDFLNDRPFGGLAIYLSDGAPAYSNNISQTVNTTTSISYQTALDLMDPLVGLSYGNLTDNFGIVYGSSPPDFFDSWTTTIENWVNVARAAKDSGLKGLIFDNEQYSSPWANWRDSASEDPDMAYPLKTLAEYQAQAYLRGRQVMEAINSEVEDFIIMTLHGPYISEPDAPGDDDHRFYQVQSNNELLGPFFAGFMEGVGSGDALCIDGGELYLLRTASHFENSAEWRRDTLPSSSVDCDFIPASNPDLRSVWADRISISFGVLQNSCGFSGGITSESALRSTLANALQVADRYVWLYSESEDYLRPESAGGAEDEWVEAVAGATADAGTPAAPTDLAPTNSTATTLTLTWTDNSSIEDHFAIDRYNAGMGVWSEVGTVAADTTTFTESGLASGTVYAYRVRAANEYWANDPVYSEPVGPLFIQTRVSGSPASPTQLTVTGVTSTTVSLAWTDNSSNENGFSIEWLVGGTWSQTGTTVTDDADFVKTGLTANTSYTFRVWAFNQEGSWYTNEVTATTSN